MKQDFVSMTLDESKNLETDRAKLQDTLEGMFKPKGINIHGDTLEEPKTDTAKGPNSVDRKGLNCHDCKTRVHINKQSPDMTEGAADGVHVDKGDFDDLVVQVPQTQIVEKTVEISQLQTLEKITGEETSSLRQSAGMLVRNSLRMTCQVESQRVENVFNWEHSFGTHQVNTAFLNMAPKALTLSIITRQHVYHHDT